MADMQRLFVDFSDQITELVSKYNLLEMFD